MIADLTGGPLGGALAGAVDLLKLSAEELVRDGHIPRDDSDNVRTIARRLHAAGAERVVITRASDPARDSVLLRTQTRRLRPDDAERAARFDATEVIV